MQTNIYIYIFKYICMCIYIYVYIHVGILTFVYVFICVHVYFYLETNKSIRIDVIRQYVNACKYVYVNMYLCFIHMCICV